MFSLYVQIYTENYVNRSNRQEGKAIVKADLGIKRASSLLTKTHDIADTGACCSFNYYNSYEASPMKCSLTILIVYEPATIGTTTVAGGQSLCRFYYSRILSRSELSRKFSRKILRVKKIFLFL